MGVWLPLTRVGMFWKGVGPSSSIFAGLKFGEGKKGEPSTMMEGEKLFSSGFCAGQVGEIRMGCLGEMECK